MQAINDIIAPSRPSMPRVSRELFNSGRYCASLTRAGLIVQSHTSGTGRLLPNHHKQFQDYLEAFDSLCDDDEGNALCRALMI